MYRQKWVRSVNIYIKRHVGRSDFVWVTGAEVEKLVEAGKELPRKYLRLAESFKENDTNRGY